jgi:nucleotide-binding universal stress UspA family protein
VTLNQQLVDEARERAQTYLDDVAGGLRDDGLQVETHVTVEPQPATGIVSYARDERFDLVAMATHGRGGVSRALLGSVADKVLRGGHAPTLVVRPAEE